MASFEIPRYWVGLRAALKSRHTASAPVSLRHSADRLSAAAGGVCQRSVAAAARMQITTTRQWELRQTVNCRRSCHRVRKRYCHYGGLCRHSYTSRWAACHIADVCTECQLGSLAVELAPTLRITRMYSSESYRPAAAARRLWIAKTFIVCISLLVDRTFSGECIHFVDKNLNLINEKPDNRKSEYNRYRNEQVVDIFGH